jgi:3'-5' exoribonuclease
MKKAKITQISEFKKNTNVQGFFLVREKHVRSTRNNHPYLQLELQDNSGDIEAKIWENVPAFEKTFEAGDAVVAKGRVSEYAERLQLEIEDIARASQEKHAEYGFDLSKLIPATRKNIDTMWKSLGQIINSMNNEYLKKLVADIYRKHAETIKSHPASMRLHHAWLGGYLEHILSMSRIGKFLGKHYGLDTDLLLAGIMLHDIGKIVELNPAQKPGYTDEGILIGHIVLGRDIVRETISHIKKFPAELQLKIEHMVLSHQGKYEWQSPKQPKFPEALLLHQIDEMDARMNMIREAIRKDNEQGSWTNKFNYFRIPLLKGELKEDKDEII